MNATRPNTTVPTVTLDTCPRCGGGFHCGVNEPAPCPCTTLKLEDTTLAALRQQFKGCLCLRCLQQLAAEPQGSGQQAQQA